MSDREKKLVLFFGLAAFLLVNFFGISWFQGQKQKIARQLGEAKGKVDLALVTSESYDTVIEEMNWMEEKSPDPRSGQLVGSKLQEEVANHARIHQLEVKRQVIKPNDEEGVYFHRAKVEFNVTGREDSLYRWLDKLQMPEQFKAVTSMRLKPDDKDDTMIDAIVEIEQWYIPLAEGEEAAPVESSAPQAVPVEEAAPAPETTNPPGTE